MQVAVSVGGIVRTFTLDANGRSPAGAVDSFTLSLKRVGGVVQANAAAKFTLKLGKSSLAATLRDEGLAAALRGRKQPREVAVRVLFGAALFESAIPVRFTNTSGKTGTTTVVKAR